jgi:predicted permease
MTSLFGVVLRALVPLFLLILLGVFLKRVRVLHAAHVPVLNGLVINVTLPALIFLALARAPVLPASDARLPMALWLAEAVTMAVAYATGRLLRLSRPALGALMIVGVFGNTAFLGYPITLALLSKEFPETVLLDEFGCVVVLYLCAAVLGGAFGTHAGDYRVAVQRFSRSPLFLALVAGLVVHLIPWPLSLTESLALRTTGGIIVQCLTYLSLGTTPLILLSLGVMLQPQAALAAPGAALLPCVLKLIVCPLMMWAICRSFGFHGGLLQVGVLQAGMPTSVLASVLCAQNDLEGPLAVGVVFLSTVLSLLTLPCLLSWLH